MTMDLHSEMTEKQYTGMIVSMENARLYSAANALQRTDARHILQEMVPALPLKNGARVLDVGCGSGDVTAEVLMPLLPAGVEEVVGVDVSDGMVEHARQVHGCPRLSFVQLDIEEETENTFLQLSQRLRPYNNNHGSQEEKSSISKVRRHTVDILINGLKMDDKDTDLQWRNAEEKEAAKEVMNSRNNNEGTDVRFCCEETKFDVIFSFYCLHWIQNQSQAFKNMYGMLKFGGEAVLVLLANSSIFTLYETVADIPKWSAHMQDVEKFISPYHHSEDPAKELSDLAASVGFHVLSVECRCRSFIYQDSTAIQDAIKAVNPFYPRLSAAQGDKYLADCLAVVKEQNLAEVVSEGLRVNYTLLVAHLRK